MNRHQLTEPECHRRGSAGTQLVVSKPIVSKPIGFAPIFNSTDQPLTALPSISRLNKKVGV